MGGLSSRAACALTALRALALVVGSISSLAWGQSVEVEVGGGYLRGAGSSSPPPSLPALHVGAALALPETWALSIAHDRTLRGDTYRLPDSRTGRPSNGVTHGNQWRVTARRSWSSVSGASIALGAGGFVGHHAEVLATVSTAQTRVVAAENRWSGLALEAILSKTIGPRAAIRAVVGVDASRHARAWRPAVLGVLRVGR